MDINDLRTISTLLALAAFVGIVVWAFSGRRKHAFDEAANLPLDEDQPTQRNENAGQLHN